MRCPRCRSRQVAPGAGAYAGYVCNDCGASLRARSGAFCVLIGVLGVLVAIVGVALFFGMGNVRLPRRVEVLLFVLPIAGVAAAFWAFLQLLRPTPLPTDPLDFDDESEDVFVATLAEPVREPHRRKRRPREDDAPPSAAPLIAILLVAGLVLVAVCAGFGWYLMTLFMRK